jgi:hypothetical protein
MHPILKQDTPNEIRLGLRTPYNIVAKFMDIQPNTHLHHVLFLHGVVDAKTVLLRAPSEKKLVKAQAQTAGG